MDGVITDTAVAHATAWKRLFDAYLESRAHAEKHDLRPFDAGTDYREYVDGKPRYDGVRCFLESRGIDLPFGDPGDAPDRETVCGLGNRKTRYFDDWLRHHKVRVFPGTLEFAKAMRRAGVAIAIFSASRHLRQVLDNAELADLFDASVDGQRMAQLGLPGKPDPAIIRATADAVGAPAARCVVVEDAIAGVQAGHRAAAAWVIGIDREGFAAELHAGGADVVVDDLAECRVDAAGTIEVKTARSLGPVWDERGDIAAALGERQAVVLLDYDGTLTPIVADYRKALLQDSMRTTLATLAERHVVAVISGRDLEDVQRLVGLDNLFYSGSHGFELSGPGGWRHVHEGAVDYLADLDRAEARLGSRLEAVPGHAIERKRFSIAVHYRQVAGDRVADVTRAVDDVLADNPRLVKGLGKKVYELKPALEWDKGSAVELLLDKLGRSNAETLAFYIGDDITDEAVFRVLRPPNYSILVVDEDHRTSADFALYGCDDVQRFLEWLSDRGGDGSA